MTESIENFGTRGVETTSMFHPDDVHPIESCEAVVAGKVIEVSEHPTNFEGVVHDLVGCYQKDTDINEKPTISLGSSKVVDTNLANVETTPTESSENDNQ